MQFWSLKLNSLIPRLFFISIELNVFYRVKINSTTALERKEKAMVSAIIEIYREAR